MICTPYSVLKIPFSGLKPLKGSPRGGCLLRAQPAAVVRESLGLPGWKRRKETTPHVSVGTSHRRVFHGETEKFVCDAHVCTRACTHICAQENHIGKITERFSDYRLVASKGNLVLKSKSKIGDTDSP